jgi:TPR repeat protein
MNLRKAVCAWCTGLVLAGGMAGGAMAGPYNEGFIAAESGDYKTAVQMWEPLAKQGNPLAQFNMALLYHSGLGVEQDESMAVNWYHKAADNGYYMAQEYLAVGYQEGWFGLPKDQKKAKYWQRRVDNGL